MHGQGRPMIRKGLNAAVRGHVDVVSLATPHKRWISTPYERQVISVHPEDCYCSKHVIKGGLMPFANGFFLESLVGQLSLTNQVEHVGKMPRLIRRFPHGHGHAVNRSQDHKACDDQDKPAVLFPQQAQVFQR